MKIEDEDFKAVASGEVAERTLGVVAQERIAQREKTKRLLIMVVCFLFSLAVVAILFAPEGKEVVGWVLGSALIILALGAIGASRFLLKVPGARIDTHVRSEGPDRFSHHDIQIRMDEE